MPYQINGVTVKPPQDAPPVNRPIAGITLNGQPVYQGYPSMTWTWEVLTMADYATLLGIYNSLETAGSTRTQIQFHDPETNSYVVKWVTCERPVVSARFTLLVRNVTMHFTRIADTQVP